MKLYYGKRIFDVCKKLINLNRSLTGEGNRQTLRVLSKINKNLKIKKFKSGEKIFDWKIPLEWNIKNAWIKDGKNKKIIDFKNNNLHVVGYSIPIKKTLSLKLLKKNLFTYKKLPNAIPYVTSYYKKNWGFCIQYKYFKKLKKDNYKVYIDSELKKGVLNYGEIIIPGKSKKEVLLSTYICHPSMANNETSGISVLIYLSSWIQALKKRKYTYRIIFVPEAIGSLAYLKRNYVTMKKNTIGGFVITCVGDDKSYSILSSRNENTYSEIISERVLKKIKANYKKYHWLTRGSDERMFNGPGFDLPISSIMRSKYGTYPEYHTSLDNLDLVSPKSFQKSFNFCKAIIQEIENSVFPIAVNKGEPFLQKKNLYHNSNNIAEIKNWSFSLNLLNILSYCDGRNDLEQIRLNCKLNKKTFYKIFKIALRNKLLKILQTKEV